MRRAICPGSFDPVTVGHLDLAERAAAIFDEVVVCVMVNGEKRTMFTPRQRLEMVQAAVGHLPNVRAALWEGLLADFARREGARALVKGARGGTDFDWEYQMAQINRDLWPALDTVILPARAEHLHISSTMVRDMLRHGQRLEPYVPAGALEVLRMIQGGKKEDGK